jgi:glyoxylase-like metal-dependent hydrolase (beta-lactamase superfamily II)/rhodanese-related sulfurtransferase
MARWVEVVGFVDEGLGHSSYLVDLGDRTALVVDPRRIPEAEQAAAAARGLTIAFTADTHSHADFVSGSPELCAQGATFLAPASGRIDVAHHGLHDGDRMQVGAFVLEAIATPGHTPDHLAYLLRDGDGDPVALFSGGSLMVGTVGRTDLLGPDRAEALAREQFHSLYDRILQLPDDVPVYPTHGAGSFCSAPGGGERTTTIGRERAENPLLREPDEEGFVQALLSGFGSFPAYFRRLPEVNRRGPRVYGTMPELPRLDLAAFRRLLNEGVVLVDARPIARYAAGHIVGALSIELRPVFATWIGWLVDAAQPIVFVLDGDQDRHELVRQCLTVGMERLAGELAGGMAVWHGAGLPTASTECVAADAVGGTVIDVRQRDEFLSGHVPGASNVELGALAVAAEVPAGELTVMCGHGERAMTGASIIEQLGRTDVSVVIGGPADWSAATGRELVVGS